MDRKIILLAGAAVAVFILLTAGGVFFWRRQSAPITLTYWGLWEPESVYAEVIADYKRRNPNITVKYLKQSPLNYRSRLQEALSRDSGPDIVRIHGSWLVMFKNSLAPFPANLYSASTFRSAFYPAAAGDLISNEQVYALPLEIDVLVMYANDDLLRAGNVNVPTVWDGAGGFLEAANKLTVRDGYGRITTAGTALGTASNTDHWQDIVALMLLQAGVDLNKNANSLEAAAALGFYSSFAASQHIWDETLDNSTLAFAQGKVAMYFAPSWRYFDLKVLNPNLNFRMVPVPQLSGAGAVNYASSWAEAVSKKSKNQKAAWEFLKYLSGKEALTKLYAAQSKLRTFGEPYSRIEMGKMLAADTNLGAVITSAPTAKSWYLASFTNDGDTGINSKIGKYYADAINSMLRGGSAKSALDTVAKGVEQVLGTYGVVK